MNIHLSIVVPIHTIPKGDRVSALARWSQDIPKGSELILCLDVDRDDTSLVEWCEANIKSPKRIVRRFNGNPGSTRNMGVQLAMGEWVAFVDSDDLFHPDRALKVIESFGEISDLVVCNFQTFDLQENLIGESKKVSNLSELNLNLGFWRCLYRKTFVVTTNFPSIRMAEDQVFFARLLTLDPRIKYCDEYIYGYFVGGDEQLTAMHNAKKDLKKAICILQREIGQSNINLSFRKQQLLRQYVSLLKDVSLADSVKCLLRMLRLLIKPSYLGRFISLVIMIVRSRIRFDRLGHL